jgi:hypothetical protein
MLLPIAALFPQDGSVPDSQFLYRRRRIQMQRIQEMIKTVLLTAPVCLALAGPAFATSISITTDGTTPWTVSVPGEGISGATPYVVGYSHGTFTQALGVTSSGNSGGTFVGGGSVGSFDGFWTLNYAFTLPSTATSVLLSFNSLFADDRAVLELNGTMIGNTDVTGNGVVSGQMTLTDGGPNNNFNFTEVTSGSISAGFNLGAANTLTIIVNNTGNGAFGAPADVSGGDYTVGFLEGTLSYNTGGSSVPEPGSAVLLATALGALALRICKGSQPR